MIQTDHSNVLVPNILLPCQLLHTWSPIVLPTLGRLANAQGEKTCLGIMRSSCIHSCLASQSPLNASMLQQFQRNPIQSHKLVVSPQDPGTTLFLFLRALQGTGAGSHTRCGSSSTICLCGFQAVQKSVEALIRPIHAICPPPHSCLWGSGFIDKSGTVRAIASDKIDHNDALFWELCECLFLSLNVSYCTSSIPFDGVRHTMG